MSFQINDTVSVLDDAIDGVVIAVNGDEITIESEDGFPMQYTAKQLVKIGGETFTFHGIQHAKSQKVEKKKVHHKGIAHVDEYVVTVDLHIEKLVRKKGGMSNYQILSLQLDTAKYRLDLAIKQRLPKIVFVHGVGDGVLKADLYSLFRRYDRIQFYEANYREYGQGATEIKIFQQK